ncbi:MAG TPA: hypothetical protein VF384_18735 [Planctomycetota bacterium]
MYNGQGAEQGRRAGREFGHAYWPTGTWFAVLAVAELATTLVIHTEDGSTHL